MENELPVPHTSSGASVASTPSGGNTSGSSGSGSGRPAGPQISVYSGIPDRQTVQVIQQALHRQPGTAAQYLQQMYAAQQQHLMLQTAALQQQHLSSAQLQSLAAVQQASLVASRQGSSSGSSVSAQTPAQSASINLAAAPAAAQLINRAQSVNSAAASGIAQQAVLLGNTAAPALTASQAQMYLRAQMLIFTPTATVATVQPELGTGSPARPPTPAQVQNLTLRAQQAPAAAASGPPPTQPVLPSVALKPTPGGGQPPPAPSQGRNTAQGSPAGARPGITDSIAEPARKGDGSSSVPGSTESRAGPGRMVPAVAAHPLIAPAYAQLQPHQLLPPPASKHLQPQFVIQQQPPPPLTRPALQAQAQPQLPPGPPSLTLQPGSEAQAMPLGPVTPTLPLQGPAASLHKPGSAQQGHPPSPDAGPHNGYPEVLPHAPPRRFQHASAVILQLQPASPVPQQYPPDDWKEVVAGEKSVPETRSGPSPHQQAIVTAMSGGLPVPKSPNVQQQPPAHETGQGIVHALTDLSSPGMTSGNGNSASSITGTAPQNGENKPPQAIVKPQILTHVIEGFVIQEGAEPFPVGRSSLLVGNLKKKYAQGFLPEKLPQQDHTTTTDSEMEEPYLQESKEEGTPLKLKCELCGRVDFAYKFKRSKRFCSMACAKRYNVGCTKRVGLFHSDRSKLQKAATTTHNRRRASKASLPTLTKDTKKQPTGAVPLSVTAALQLTHSQEDSSRCSDNSSYEEPLSPISASSSTSRRRQGQRDLELPDMHMRDLVGMGHHFLPSEPTKWNVEDVYEFIRSLPGCQEIAEEFRAQEIDGQALLLLKEDHLMSAMNIKLGPALKIYARINMLKDS
ncbi:polyhomeotic-like protein 2 isoform X1 [Sorex araneus]|uniref:polyhomeotic-like protein 2 isoform X1 n=3 Tax=Sorex araneus TaxID=42254 RepID=UPI0024340544|nr:polyhomeotic-like protein 2 isoform X1 [Sorex araneus]XP_054996313.1 polyhomeotic-like protein 2 isoform X1 [Sorex araneus]XP_054996314.1 polyhomeotic-like protein 2 isoform X1 [Sorex araneus]